MLGDSTFSAAVSATVFLLPHSARASRGTDEHRSESAAQVSSAVDSDISEEMLLNCKINASIVPAPPAPVPLLLMPPPRSRSASRLRSRGSDNTRSQSPSR